MDEAQRRYISALVDNLKASLEVVDWDNSRDTRDMVGHDLRCLTHYWTEVVLPDLVYTEAVTDEKRETT